jgi:hypothetical protein
MCGLGAAPEAAWKFLPMSASGPELTPPRRRRMAAFKGEAVISLYQFLVSN